MSVNDENNPAQIYKVLVNFEEQYSFWPALKKSIPSGWQETGQEGTKAECAAYVREVWKDMRPLSIRTGKLESFGRVKDDKT